MRLQFLLLGMLGFAVSSMASVIVESGNFTGTWSGTGSQQVNQEKFMGWRFTLASDFHITRLGGSIYLSPIGCPCTGSTMFGAIVPIADMSSFPDPPATFTPVLSVLLHPPVNYNAASPASESVDAVLSAGTYALVFGSGRFGADAGHWGAMAAIGSTVTVPNSNLNGSTISNDWGAWTNGNYYFVEGDFVPEPSTLVLMVTGLALAVLGRRKSV
ncbi:MAG: PEP-CTERM sorting domain-containing protein [Bryobacteraceae bacterium]